MNWQFWVTLGCVATAAGLLLLRFRGFLQGASPGCGSCSRCPSEPAAAPRAEPAELLQINPLRETASAQGSPDAMPGKPRSGFR